MLLDWQARHGGALTRIAVSRAEPVGRHHLWRPLPPVTQLAVAQGRLNAADGQAAFTGSASVPAIPSW